MVGIVYSIRIDLILTVPASSERIFTGMTMVPVPVPGMISLKASTISIAPLPLAEGDCAVTVPINVP